MLTSITTKNFGVLPNKEYTFTGGLNIIRSKNEAGKSTLVEAFLYALFGSQMLRGSVDEATTDGKSGLKVVVKYGDYTISRTKSSASVIGPGVKISGQANVGNFFHEMFGTTKETITSILVSEQGKTAGIMAAKPAAVTTLIEQLAGFDQIDDLIEKAKVEYPSGDVALYTELLKEAESALQVLNSATPEDPEHASARVRTAQQSVDEVMARLAEAQAKQKELEIDLATVTAHNARVDSLNKQYEAAELRLSAIKTNIDLYREVSERPLTPVDDERDYIAAYPDLRDRNKLLEAIVGLGQPEDDIWEGDFASLTEEIEQTKREVEVLRTKKADIQAEIKQAESLLNPMRVCPTCGQDTSKLHAEMNAKATEDIKSLQKDLDGVKTSEAEAREYLSALEDISSEQRKREQYIEYAIDTGQVPWFLEWKGDIPDQVDPEKLKDCQAKVAAYEKASAEVEAAKKSLTSLAEDYVVAKKEYDEIKSEMSNVTPIDQTAVEGLVSDAKAITLEEQNKLSEASTELKKAEAHLSDVKTQVKQHTSMVEKHLAEVDKFKMKIKIDSENAAILKEMRNAKPKVLSKVWNRVLAAVAADFSRMRGTESVVERKEKGFYINGLPVHRLSGSAKSILGISVRQTLRDVFAPTAGPLIFDEPAADCDVERTAMVIGAIRSLPGQVIMITHEDLSDSFADNLIELIG